MRKPSKKRQESSDLSSSIMSYALGSKNIAFFIFDLEAEIRSIYLIRDSLKMEILLGELTDLEKKILKFKKKMVLDVIKDLRKKFPYIPNAKKD